MNSAKKRMKKVAIIALLLLLSALCYGEIHPKYYQQDQENADEALIIRVTKVRKGCCFACRNQKVRIHAEVLSVERSRSGLEKGSTITIRYNHFNPPRKWVGPRPVPILKKGKEYPAFLNRMKDEEYYVPAARGYSFERVTVY